MKFKIQRHKPLMLSASWALHENESVINIEHNFNCRHNEYQYRDVDVILLQNELCLFSNKTRIPPEIKSRNWKTD
jgi:hypothetical protein